jgi:hypothetical protein
MKLRYLLLALTAAALLPVLGGCGGGEDEATAQTTMPLKKYAHETDLICGDASVEQSKIAIAIMEKNPEVKRAELVEPAAIPPLEKQLQELHDLGLPGGHEDEAEAVIEEMEAALEALKEEPKGALSEKNNPFEKSNQLAAKLGLGDCSQNP